MSRRAHALPLALVLAFALFVPTFWVTDIAQAAQFAPRAQQVEVIAPAAPAHASHADGTAEAGSMPDEVYPYIDTSVPVSTFGSGGKMFSSPLGNGAAIAAAALTLPPLTLGIALAHSRSVLPPAPFIEVPTTPPLSLV